MGPPAPGDPSRGRSRSGHQQTAFWVADDDPGDDSGVCPYRLWRGIGQAGFVSILKSRPMATPRTPTACLSVRPPSRWGIAAAYAAFLVVVPSAVWRAAVVWGWLPGTGALRSDILATSGAGYVLGLSVVQLLTGFLAVGLVSRWGVEVLGWRPNRFAVLAAALLGALGATLIFTVSMTTELLSGARPDKGLVTGSALDLMIVCYAPIVLWGPLVGVAAFDYARRTRRSATREP